MSDNDNTGNGDNREHFPKSSGLYLEAQIELLREGLQDATQEHRNRFEAARKTEQNVIVILKNIKDELAKLNDHILSQRNELDAHLLSQNNKLDQNFDKLYDLINQFLNKMQETVDTEQDRKKIQEDIAEMEQHLKKTNDRITHLCIFGSLLCILIIAGLLVLLA